jgi:single-strand DNA-binding protein
MNKVFLLGRLGKDPEVKKIGADLSVCNFTVATTEYVKDGDKRAEWHRVVCFGKNAENVGKYLKKGSQVAIEGKNQTREWEKDGEKRYSTEIIVNHIEFVGTKSASTDALVEEIDF